MSTRLFIDPHNAFRPLPFIGASSLASLGLCPATAIMSRYLTPLPDDRAVPCDPFGLLRADWALGQDPLRRKAQSTEEVADANAIHALKPREDIVEHAIVGSEGPVRRDVESALSVVGKEGPKVNSRAVRTLKQRRSSFPQELEVETQPAVLCRYLQIIHR